MGEAAFSQAHLYIINALNVCGVMYMLLCPACFTNFNHLESLGYLDPLSDTDLFSLHYVYVPRINQALDGFVRGWNHHTISGQGKSPAQMFWMNRPRPLDRNKFFDPLFGIDNEDPVRDNDDEATVSIPEIQVPISDHQMSQLHVTVNPLDCSDHHGIDLYLIVLLSTNLFHGDHYSPTQLHVQCTTILNTGQDTQEYFTSLDFT